METGLQLQFKVVVTFGLPLPLGEGTDNRWRQLEEKEGEKAREALGGRSREIRPLPPTYLPSSTFKAKKENDPDVDFV